MSNQENEKEMTAPQTEQEEAVNETPDAADEMRTQLEALKKENEELSDRLYRTAAEFDNYKKRTAKEKQELSSFAKGVCIKEMLTASDNFERALNAPCKDEEFKKGMEMIFNQLCEAFSRVGVKEIEALGNPFDPNIHHAIKQVEDESFGENIVCEVLQKGYELDGHVIRHAMVVVANP